MDYEAKIADRLTRVLSDPELHDHCRKAYAVTLGGLGLSGGDREAELLLAILKRDVPLREREDQAWAHFKTLSVTGKNFDNHITALITERRKIMLGQISPYLLTTGQTADFGAGNGEFMRLVAQKFPDLKLEGWDIVTDDPEGQVQAYDGEHIPRPDGYYSQVYATTVLHHLDTPVTGARELVRLSQKRIILIETIAGLRTGNRIKDHDITFVVDYFWRLLHRSSEPVPGSYLTVPEWIGLFETELHCHLEAFVDFGSDQKTMTEKHVLLVFDKPVTL